jgi:hypothetical protein
MKILILSWLVFAALFVAGITLWIANIGLNFKFTSVVLQGICLLLIGGGVLTVISILAVIKEVIDISSDQT